jgi:hypothetical protein
MTIDGVLDGDRDARSGPGDPVHPDYGLESGRAAKIPRKKRRSTG